MKDQLNAPIPENMHTKLETSLFQFHGLQERAKELQRQSKAAKAGGAVNITPHTTPSGRAAQAAQAHRNQQEQMRQHQSMIQGGRLPPGRGNGSSLMQQRYGPVGVAPAFVAQLRVDQPAAAALNVSHEAGTGGDNTAGKVNHRPGDDPTIDADAATIADVDKESNEESDDESGDESDDDIQITVINHSSKRKQSDAATNALREISLPLVTQPKVDDSVAGAIAGAGAGIDVATDVSASVAVGVAAGVAAYIAAVAGTVASNGNGDGDGNGSITQSTQPALDTLLALDTRTALDTQSALDKQPKGSTVPTNRPQSAAFYAHATTLTPSAELGDDDEHNQPVPQQLERVHEPVRSTDTSVPSGLPPGWDRRTAADGRTYYVCTVRVFSTGIYTQ
jgi:hypothetical protein